MERPACACHPKRRGIRAHLLLAARTNNLGRADHAAHTEQTEPLHSSSGPLIVPGSKHTYALAAPPSSAVSFKV